MKKRYWLVGIVLLLVGVALLLGYVFRASFRQPVVYEQISSLFPPRPLAYVQCTQLESRLKDFSQRESYQAFLQSPLFAHIRSTAWWQDVAFSLQDSLQGMAIDPLRIVGTDVALGIYPTQEEQDVPGVLVMTKIDRGVKFAERLIYLVGMISGQIGIQEQCEVEGIPVYRIQNTEMLFPVYYSVIGELGILSTSVPLLQQTMLQALGKTPPPGSLPTEELQSQDLFAHIVETRKAERFVTMYWESSKFLDELQRFQFWDFQELFDESLLASLATLPVFQIAVDVSAQSLMFSLDMFSSALPPEEEWGIQEIFDEKTLETLFTTSPQDYALLAAMKRTQLEPLFSTLNHLFPQQSWQDARRWNTRQSVIWGDILECRLSAELFGTMYPIPDFSCILETHHPGRARVMLEYAVNSVFERLFPSAIQRRAMVSMANESYRNFTLSSWRAMFQEVFVFAVPQQASQPGSTIVATQTGTLKTHIDLLQSSSAPHSITGIPPIFFDLNVSPPSSSLLLPIGGILIRTGRLLELLDKLSQTSSFSLLFPQKRYPEFYHTISAFRQSEAALPDVIFGSLYVHQPTTLSLHVSFWKP